MRRKEEKKKGRKKQASSNIHVHQRSLRTQCTVCSITPLRDVVSYTHKGEGEGCWEGSCMYIQYTGGGKCVQSTTS